MKRKMIYAAVFYMLGLFFASFFTGWIYMIPAIGVAVVLYGLSSYVKDNGLVFAAVFFIIANISYNTYNSTVYQKVIACCGKNVSCSGKIVDVDFYDADMARYIIKGKINNEVSAKMMLYGDAKNYNIGDIINFDCVPSKIKSDYLFDGKEYYKSQKIFITADKAGNIKMTHTDGERLRKFLYNWREKAVSDFKLSMGPECGNFMAGIVFGEKSNVDESVKTSLFRCGIGHIMAVSGLHAAAVAAIIMAVLKRFRINRFISFAVITVFLILMSIMVEAPVSVIRAAIMLTLIYSGQLFRRKADTANSLAIACIMICVANPFVILSPAYWLSVAGTFGIGVVAPYITENFKVEKTYWKLLKDIVSFICAGIIVTIPALKYFDEISLISPVTNLLIVPLCMIVLIIGIIYVLSGGFVSFLLPAKYIVMVILKVSDVFSKSGLSYFSVNSKYMFPVFLLLASICAAVFFVYGNKRLFCTCVACSLIIFTMTSTIFSVYNSSMMKVAVLGRNSNLSVVVTYKGNTDIVDLCGYGKNCSYVRKYLMQNGVDDVDSLTLCKNVNSIAVSYASALNFYDINETFMPNKYPIVGIEKLFNKTVIYGDEGFEIKRPEYTITFCNSSLYVNYNGKSILITKNQSENKEHIDIIVYYGSSAKTDSTQNSVNQIYIDKKENFSGLSGTNNFVAEIKSDNVRIRRL